MNYHWKDIGERIDLAIFGIVGTLFGIWAFYETRETKQLSYRTVTHPVYSASGSFDANVRVADVDVSKVDLLSETVVVVWSSGSAVFRQDDIRIPLQIRFGDNIRIFGFRVLETKSSVQDNFGVTAETSNSQTGTALNLSFKIFDPNMAIKIAMLHQGSGETIAVGGDIGPEVEFREAKRATALYGLLLLLVAIILWVAYLVFVPIRGRGTIMISLLLTLLVGSGTLWASRVVAVLIGSEPPLSLQFQRGDKG
jgi:hypothetical protein